MPKPYRWSPAVIELARAGLTLGEIARPLGIDPKTLGQQFAYRARLHKYAIPTIRALAGDRVAEAVLHAYLAGSPRAAISEDPS